MSTPERRARNAALTAQLQQAGNAERDGIIDALVLGNLDTARSVARRYAGRSGFGQDLEQVASLALVRAAQEFDPARGHEFLAYAMPCVRGAVKHYFRDSAWVVRPPRDVQQHHVAHGGLTDHVADGVQVESCFRPWSLDAPMPGDETPPRGDARERRGSVLGEGRGPAVALAAAEQSAAASSAHHLPAVLRGPDAATDRRRTRDDTVPRLPTAVPAPGRAAREDG